MKRIAAACVIALLSTGFGCVIRTEHKIDLHITLDIRHVEEEVGGVFDYVEGSADALPDITAPPAEKSTSWLHRAGDALFAMPVACAEETATSPLVREIADSMKKRYPDLAAKKADGCLGENNRGYVELRDCNAAKDPKKKNEIQQILTDENKDRKALYKEFARLKKLDVETLEGVGAKDKLKRAKTGEWVQLPEVGKDFDELKASDTGKKLGNACQPGAWVEMP